jgi:hypothetical protein
LLACDADVVEETVVQRGEVLQLPALSKLRAYITEPFQPCTA